MSANLVYAEFGLAMLLVLAFPFLAGSAYGLYLAYKLYHPYRRPSRKPELTGLDSHPVRIPSGPGMELDGLFLKASGADHLVLIAHEIGSFKESKLRLARRLILEGHNVLLFDLRNHGGSSRDRSWWPMSERFTDDIESALRFARGHYPEMGKTSLLTFSFSTFPSLYIIRRDIPQPDSIILDSGPAPSVENLYGKFMDYYGSALVPGILRLPPLFAVVKGTFQYFGLKMLATTWPPDFSKIRSHVLFIMNGNDPIFPESEIQAVARRISKSQEWVCPESSHLQAFKLDPDGYVDVITGFLKKSSEDF